MPRYAVIDSGNRVGNVIIADSLLAAQELSPGFTVVFSNEAGIDYTFNTETGEFTAPVVDAPAE